MIKKITEKKIMNRLELIINVVRRTISHLIDFYSNLT